MDRPLPREEKAACANCGVRTPIPDMKYDELGEYYYCDKACFIDHANERFTDIVEWYYKTHIAY